MNGAAVLPDLRLRLDGRPVADAVVAALDEVRVARALSRPAQCALTLTVDGATASAPASFRPGLALELVVGDHPCPLFQGEVTGVESLYDADGARRLRVRAYDRLHRLRQVSTTRAFVDVSVAELARELLGRHVPVAGADGPRRDVVAGAGTTDLDLLVRTATRVGLHVVDDGDAVRLTGLDGHGAPVVLRLGAGVVDLAVDVDRHRSVDGVEAVSWRPGDAAVLQASAPGRVAGPPAGWEAPALLFDVSSSAPDELAAVAAGEAARRDAARLVVRATVEGRTDVVPGRRIRVEGVDELGDAVVTVTRTVATIDADGFVVRLSSEPPPPAPPPGPAVITVGEVADVDDPEGRARVQVRLPVSGGVVSPWSPVVVAGAGPGRGLVVLPDVGDVVAVALLGGDPARAVVLGGLYGPAAPTDAGVVGGRVRRFALVTTSGAALTLDDDGSHVGLAHPNGSAVALGGGELRITSTVPLVLDAGGQAVTIRARTVDFQEAP